ncbi:MAG: hypothetical protein DRG83_06095 [Deltaproteobacteria bacterium]|nr:MAG: hypothetical protein DRG83_06095 [Deltaproteobacteria bacterium]
MKATIYEINHDIQGYKKTIVDFLEDTVRNFGSQIALIAEGKTITYGNLLDAVTAVASILRRDFQIKKGERVVLLMFNSIEFVIVYYSLMWIGAVAVPLNWRLSHHELQSLITECEPALSVVDAKLWQERREFFKSHLGHKIFVVERKQAFQDVVRSVRRREPREDIRPDDPAVIMFTAGTTGSPKGAVLTHWNIAYTSQNIRFMPGFKYLVFSPNFHATGLNASLNTCVANAGTAVLMERFRTTEALRLIHEEKVQYLAGVPTAIKMMLEWRDVNHFDLTSVQYLSIGGAPVTEEFVDLCSNKLPGVVLMQAYGLTETSAKIIVRDCAKVKKPMCLGFPLPKMQVKIIDEKGFEVPLGEIGEIAVKGPAVMKQYWNRPRETELAIKDGWFHTGDLGKIDSDGYVYLAGRKKELIIRGGENIYPLEVENAIVEHPAVLECAVVGKPDPLYGEEIVAFVVLKANRHVEKEEIKEFCRERLADYKVPREVIFVSELPKNTLGKVLKAELLKMGSE